MVKVLLAVSVLIITLQARENPFFPSEGEKDIPYTSNKDQTLPKLKRATIELPSHARVIKKVTVEYENLDASVENKTIELNNYVDWHLPLFISQSYSVEDDNAQKSADETSIKLENSKEKKPSFKKIAKNEFAEFHALGKKLKIITKDKLLRNFLLVQPHRIVMDFERDSSMEAYIKNIKDSVFTKIRIGNHSGYYRVVIELDGYYRYSLKNLSDGCLVNLR